MSDKDRAERMSSRRGAARERAQERDTDGDANADDATSSGGSVKDRREEKMFYLTKDQKKDVDHLYNRLKTDYEYEYDEPLRKIEHYYPLVTQYGLAHLNGLEPQDVKEKLEGLGLIDSEES